MYREVLESMATRITQEQPLLVTFVRGDDGLDALSHLERYRDKGLVKLKGSIQQVRYSLLTRTFPEKGGGVRSLEVSFHPFVWAEKWWEKPFADLVVHGFEKIEVKSDSLFRALQLSSDPQESMELYCSILKEVFTERFLLEIKGWGFSFYHELRHCYGSYLVAIELAESNKLALRVFFDSWSGNILDARLRAFGFCARPECAREHLRKALEGYLEQATAPV